MCCANDLGSSGQLTLTSPASAGGQAFISLYASYYQQRFKLQYYQVLASGK
jgi:hypothetical protein